MQVASAYLLVVLIWSTTPLAIHWSNSSLSFISAITARMVLATLLCFGLLKICRQPLIVQRRDWLVYAASALGLFPNMLLIYWAAQTIPSGLMSVVMGIYPFFVGIFSIFVLQENPFTRSRFVALLLALLGLWLVQREQTVAGADAFWGISVIVLVCAIWGFSSVTVKKLGAEIEPLRMGTGSLLVSTPFFLLAWFGLDRELPVLIDQKSLIGVVYLVLAGSIVGHTLWFYVLRVCKVSSVSLITLITPVMALTWGSLAGEHVSTFTLLGAGVIILALALYQGFIFQLWRGIRNLVNAMAPEFTPAAVARRRRSD